MLSRFHLIPERYGQTDRRTDGRTDRTAISISRVSMLTRDKNYPSRVIYVCGSGRQQRQRKRFILLKKTFPRYFGHGGGLHSLSALWFTFYKSRC